MPGWRYLTATIGWGSTLPTADASAMATLSWRMVEMFATVLSAAGSTQGKPPSKPRFTLHCKKYD